MKTVYVSDGFQMFKNDEMIFEMRIQTDEQISVSAISLQGDLLTDVETMVLDEAKALMSVNMNLKVDCSKLHLVVNEDVFLQLQKEADKAGIMLTISGLSTHITNTWEPFYLQMINIEKQG